tara:strand:+ start:40 stop:297 length:258 start_codon:yes stop_codon:yes gene_type:complete
MKYISTLNLTAREIEFIRQATEYGNNSSAVGVMVEDFDYTAQECGGFISSLIQKNVCTEWHEPQADKGYQAQFAFTVEAIDLAHA